MKHTPAPWNCHNISEKWHGYEGWKTYAIRDGKTNGCLAIVGEVDRQFNTVNEANARLIAAAPELLEALETCLIMAILQEKRHGYTVENAKIAENIRTAIAKAKGE